MLDLVGFDLSSRKALLDFNQGEVLLDSDLGKTLSLVDSCHGETLPDLGDAMVDSDQGWHLLTLIRERPWLTLI